MNTGCFAGDGAGFPVTISRSGNYLLTSDLTVSDANTNAIELQGGTASVLDGNRFGIRGPVVCTPTCGAGTGVGIDAPQNTTSLSLKNVSVSGFGAAGVRMRSGGISCENSFIIANGGGGVINPAGILVVNADGCAFNVNGGPGIQAAAVNWIRDSSAFFNQGAGIDAVAAQGAIVEDSEIASNAGNGLALGEEVIVRGCRVRDNAGLGISVGARSLVQDNVVTRNGSTATDHQISAGADSQVRGNVIYTTAGRGIQFPAGAFGSYSNNMIQNAGGAGTVSGGSDQGHNLCVGGNC